MPGKIEMTGIDEEKFNSFTMPMLGEMPFSDFDSYEEFEKKAKEMKLEPLEVVLDNQKKYREFIENYPEPEKTKFINMMNELENTADYKNVAKNLFYCLKDVSEEMRAEASFSSAALKEYHRRKGNGYVKSRFNMGRMETNKRLLKLFNDMYKATKKGDRFYRGSSKQYKAIQKLLRDQIENLRENAADTDVSSTVKALKEMASVYAAERSTYTDVNTYKGRRVGIVKGIFETLTSDADIIDVMHVYGKDKRVQLVPVQKKVKKEADPVSKASVFVKNQAGLKKFVSLTDLLNEFKKDADEILEAEGKSFAQKLNDLKTRMQVFKNEYMKNSPITRRPAEERMKDYESFPEVSSLKSDDRTSHSLKGMTLIADNNAQISDILKKNQCEQLYSVYQKVYGAITREASSIRELNIFNIELAETMCEITSGMTLDEYRTIRHDAKMNKKPEVGNQVQL